MCEQQFKILWDRYVGKTVYLCDTGVSVVSPAAKCVVVDLRVHLYRRAPTGPFENNLPQAEVGLFGGDLDIQNSDFRQTFSARLHWLNYWLEVDARGQYLIPEEYLKIVGRKY